MVSSPSTRAQLAPVVGPVYNNGRPWTRTFMTGLSGGTLALENEVPGWRSPWARLDFLLAPLREGVPVWSGFRGIAYTARPQGASGRLVPLLPSDGPEGDLGLGPPSGRRPLRYGPLPQTGHMHARKALVRTAWTYPSYPSVSVARQPPCSARTIALRSAGVKAGVPALPSAETTPSPEGRAHGHHP